MTAQAASAVVWVIALVIVGVMFRRSRRRRTRYGSAAAGTIYGMLNEDKRHAVEIVVEGRAEARDPEDRDGNLPDLAGGTSTARKALHVK